MSLLLSNSPNRRNNGETRTSLNLLFLRLHLLPFSLSLRFSISFFQVVAQKVKDAEITEQDSLLLVLGYNLASLAFHIFHILI